MRRAFDIALRILVPLGVLAIVLAVFFGEQAYVDHELQLVVDRQVAPGPLAVRAIVLEGLEAPEGPRVIAAPVELTLRDAADRVVSRARLASSVASGADGSIDIPADAQGMLRLSGAVMLDGGAAATAQTELEVRAERSPRPTERTRDVHVVESQSPLSDTGISLRIVGGACVPETRCELLARIADRPVELRLSPTPSVEPIGPASGRGPGLIRLAVRTHGPDAMAELVATVDGQERLYGLQLPVGMATPIVRVAAIVPARVPLEVEALPDRPGLIVDAFRDGRWVRTGSVPRERGRFDAPFAPLEPGLWRIQVRTDPFGSNHAATRTVVVLGAGQTEADAARLAAHAAGEEPIEGGLDWALAGLDHDVYTMPSAVSGYDGDLRALEERRWILRVIAAVALLLGTLLAGAYFVRRGLDAAIEAQRVMDLTGDPELSSEGHRRRTVATALLISAAALFAFVCAAAIIIARARLL